MEQLVFIYTYVWHLGYLLQPRVCSLALSHIPELLENAGSVIQVTNVFSSYWAVQWFCLGPFGLRVCMFSLCQLPFIVWNHTSAIMLGGRWLHIDWTYGCETVWRCFFFSCYLCVGFTTCTECHFYLALDSELDIWLRKWVGGWINSYLIQEGFD